MQSLRIHILYIYTYIYVYEPPNVDFYEPSDFDLAFKERDLHIYIYIRAILVHIYISTYVQ